MTTNSARREDAILVPVFKEWEKGNLSKTAREKKAQYRPVVFIQTGFVDSALSPLEYLRRH
jgi:hypothetical protein